MSEQGTVLCVLSDEQRSEYRDELTGLEQRGLSLVHMDDPDEALERAAALDPQLVIAGMELGPMEGLEFLAFFMKRYPEFERTVVVLPRKDDPFPPMAHTRNPSTGRSAADEVSIDRLGDLIPEASRPQPPALAAPVLQASAVPARKRPGWLVPVIVAVAVAILGVAGFVAFSGSDEPAVGKGADPAPSEPAPAEPAPAEPAPAPEARNEAKEETKHETGEEPAATAATAVQEPAAKTREEPVAPAIDLGQPVALPFTFEKASGKPALADADRLTALIKALGESGRVELGGHTSNEGDPGYNRKLGQIRAEAVREMLVKRGVPRQRIVVKSHGGDTPVASNATEEGRRRNRRVTVRVRP